MLLLCLRIEMIKKPIKILFSIDAFLCTRTHCAPRCMHYKSEVNVWVNGAGVHVIV
jgi:hypothetical protein